MMRRGLAALALVLLALTLLAAPAQAVPGPVCITNADDGVRSVNITFETVPGAEFYNVYTSDANVSDAGDMELYDTIYVVDPPGTDVYEGVHYYNDTSLADARQAYDHQHYPAVPSTARVVNVNVTGLLGEVYIAVTAGDATGENTVVSPVRATALVEVEQVADDNASAVLLAISLILLGALAILVILMFKEKKKNRSSYLYVAPALIALVVLTFYPVAYGFYLSTTDTTASATDDPEYVGADNYKEVLSSEGFLKVCLNTLVWTVTNVFFHVTIGLFLAVLLNRKIKGRVMYRTMLLLPWAIPSYINCLIWRGMFLPDGAINTVFGLEVNWLGSMPWAMVAVITVNVWLGFPFMMMVFSGGLQGINEDLYEAAEIDGVSRWQQFRHITLPLLKPTILPAALLGFIWTFNMFNVIYLVTQGGPPSMSGPGGTDILITYVYDVAFSGGRRIGFGAAYSVVIFFMLLSFSVFYMRRTKATERVT